MGSKVYFLYDYLSSVESSKVVAHCFAYKVCLSKRKYVFDKKETYSSRHLMKWTITIDQIELCISRITARLEVDQRVRGSLRLMKKLRQRVLDNDDIYRQIRLDPSTKVKQTL